MDLKTYLANKNHSEFARSIGVSAGLIYQWLNGIRPISPDAAPKIELETGGEVRCETSCPGVTWHRDAKGNVTGHFISVKKRQPDQKRRKAA